MTATNSYRAIVLLSHEQGALVYRISARNKAEAIQAGSAALARLQESGVELNEGDRRLYVISIDNLATMRS